MAKSQRTSCTENTILDDGGNLKAWPDGWGPRSCASRLRRNKALQRCCAVSTQDLFQLYREDPSDFGRRGNACACGGVGEVLPIKVKEKSSGRSVVRGAHGANDGDFARARHGARTDAEPDQLTGA